MVAEIEEPDTAVRRLPALPRAKVLNALSAFGWCRFVARPICPASLETNPGTAAWRFGPQGFWVPRFLREIWVGPPMPSQTNKNNYPYRC